MAKSSKNSTSRDLQFLFEIGTLRNIERVWKQYIGLSVGNVLEHTVRVAFLALLIARKEKVKNEEKILKMALIHDLAETRVSDHMYVHKVYVTADEERAARDLFKGTLFNDLYADVLREYEERKTIESKIVKDADNLEVDLELKELEARGSTVREKLAISRKIVRGRLYTQAAKKLWDEIQKADVHGWHINADEWFKTANFKNKK
ncbi:MAG: HD domain-containing protein [Candidatus Pacebacteria bacterium]|nr:HD domain-containing protein [Candidatus Paceibacterota bacterium]